MTIRLSTGLRNALTQGLGFAGAFNRCSINIYSGTQPVSADAAVTGTLLGTVTASSGALTQETRASGTVTLTGGASGSINTVTVGTFNIIPDGAVAFNTSLTQTASDLADAINRNGIYTASSSGAVVTIKPRPGAGAAHNGYAVSATLTTITASYANMASGVAPVNALYFGEPAAGVIAKPTGQIWSFNGIAAGTAGWFRMIGSESDAGGLITAAPFPVRLDGSIAVSGGDASLSNITVAIGAPNTVDVFSWTQPAA